MKRACNSAREALARACARVGSFADAKLLRRKLLARTQTPADVVEQLRSAACPDDQFRDCRELVPVLGVLEQLSLIHI